ncbi:radical SAM protein [Amorphoplanes digitatis]|uniref:Radical SAM core domain-containing protein n=1 Tax=Actinoplanes digitatis TaxID=1868 RepID=A0A7W7HVQ2_9ACTN|nr:radical SAM protein [Actinoplanes digitatis]MBB4761664.1 hypothetical protein [Actinoplanes digitatis]BFE70244.1 hypothetical protein GCM10020092_035450 [Actinoplanes digitatis]GID90774.1 hypothetical protein Adi01nite_01860 [Actinoplanes digitatis]
MELAELVGLRPVPGAGVLITLTQRCPLRCAHCSTASTMAGAQPAAADLSALVDSFAQCPPGVMMLTGGEPMLRPGLVLDLARRARAAGTRSAVLTGAFFAAADPPPARLLAAATAVDHFSVSIDAFHEREVRREHVYALLRRVLDAGTPVSLHAVGGGPDDPYLAGLVARTRAVFGDAVPMLVNTVRAVGRAAAWAAARPPEPDPDRVLPCAMAAWPVVAADGAVLACCHQETVDRRPAPAHLLLGRLGIDDWAAIRARCLASPALRMIRAVGPVHLVGRFGTRPGPPSGGYCGTCRSLGERPGVLAAVGAAAAGRLGELLDEHAARIQVEAGPVALMRRHGCAAYAELVAPSRQSHRTEEGTTCRSPTC